jgi:PAS domain S-box-containing protein
MSISMSLSVTQPDASAFERYRRRFSGFVAVGHRTEPLNDAGERLELLLQATDEAVWDCNLDTRTIWWNEAYERIFGRRSPNEAGSDWWIERIHPEDRQHTVLGLEAALAGDATHWSGEYRFRREDGSYAPFRDRAFIARGPDGSPRRILTAKTDLTQQRSIEAALQGASSILQSFYDSVPICMGVVEVLDGDFEIMHANPATCKILGLDPDRARGVRLSNCGMPVEIRREWFARYKQSHAGGHPVRFEYFSPASGHWFAATVSEAAPGESGRPRIVYTAEDITAYKKSLAEQREAEERFKRLYESNIVAIASGDEEWVMDANDVFLQMLGYTRQELASNGLRWADITPPEFRHLGPQTIAGVKSTGSYGPFEKDYQRKDGSRVSVLVGCIRLQDSPYRELNFLLDLTERKRLERRVTESQKFESIGVLAGGIAHDFNNLLVGVIGHASLAEDLLPPEHPARDLLAQVIRNGEQAAHLTRQMLAYSGKGRFLLEPLDLSELYEEISILVKPAIRRDTTLEMNLPRGLPAVEADRGQMRQVFTNLVLNAAESITAKGGCIRVSTGVRHIAADPQGGEWDNDLHPGTYVYLEVTDNGCGMDLATTSRIFDPFYTTKFVGRGLGLAAVAGIVRGHKGAISVSSKPGEGSRFVVLLPAASAPAVRPPATQPVAEPHRKGTVLVVDDEAVVRQMTRAALERQGYRVILAESGREAIDMFSRDPASFSLVILDLSMPGITGAQTLPELRRAHPRIPVIITSGYSEAQSLGMFSGQKVSGFLQKPFSSQVLVARTEAALEDEIA